MNTIDANYYSQAVKKDIEREMAEFNAKVGKDYALWNEILGQHGYGVENERGDMLRHFCHMNKMSSRRRSGHGKHPRKRHDRCQTAKNRQCKKHD